MLNHHEIINNNLKYRLHLQSIGNWVFIVIAIISFLLVKDSITFDFDVISSILFLICLYCVLTVFLRSAYADGYIRGAYDNMNIKEQLNDDNEIYEDDYI